MLIITNNKHSSIIPTALQSKKRISISHTNTKNIIYVRTRGKFLETDHKKESKTRNMTKLHAKSQERVRVRGRERE